MRLAAAGTSALAFGLSPPAEASSHQSMAPNTVANIADPGTTLGVPADGRIRGYEFSAQVLGVAVGSTLDEAGGPVKSATGQKLWVFGMRWTDANQPGGPPNPITATLVVEGARISIPLPGGYGDSGFGQATFDTGPMYWVASVPAKAKDVAVELASAGFAQDFSLTHMSREGPQPAALYRDPTSWQLTQPLALEHDIPTPDPGDPNFNPFLPVDVDSLTLTWFAPDSPSDVPSDPTEAWLIPGLSSLTTTNNHNDPNVCFQPLPPTDITLTLPGAKPITATRFPGLGPDQDGYGAFVDGYGFEVPAAITTAVLTVNPGTIYVGFEGCGYSANVTTNSPAVFDLTLPGAATPTPPPGAVSVPPPIHNLPPTKTVVATPSRAPGPLSGADLALIVVGLLLAAGVAPPLLIRRRRWQQQRTGTVPAETATGGPETETSANGSEPAPHWVPTPPRSTPTVLLVPPESPPGLELGLIQGLVLGPEDIEGDPRSDIPLGPTVVEILLFLMLYRGPALSAEELREEICADRERDLDASTVRRYIGFARSVLGEEHVPRSSGGYRLAGFTTDWDRFCQFTAAAEAAAEPGARGEYLAKALSLVRGRSFSAHTGNTYVWAETKANIAGAMNNAVLSASLDLARLALDAGDPALAAWAASRGVTVWPTEVPLHKLALDAAAALGLGHLDAKWETVKAEHLRADATPSPELEQHYHQLRSRFRPPHRDSAGGR